mmetsp:Transcript_27713/g.58232  ORF Transcript_27713/g.58232 Transcript_27713/m.58232 type:complete len:203 (-) Transcript_27713:910-1518(-)
MISYTADHEFGNGIKREFAGFTCKDVGYIAQNVGSCHSGKVFIKSKQRDIFLGFFGKHFLFEIPNTLHVFHSSIIHTVLFQSSKKRLFHMFMISRIQKQLHLSFFHQFRKSADHINNKFPLGTGPSDGYDNSNGLPGLAPGNPPGARVWNSFHQISRNPMSRQSQLVFRYSHLEEGMIVGRTLHKVQCSGNDDKPLRVIIDD